MKTCVNLQVTSLNGKVYAHASFFHKTLHEKTFVASSTIDAVEQLRAMFNNPVYVKLYVPFSNHDQNLGADMVVYKYRVEKAQQFASSQV